MTDFAFGFESFKVENCRSKGDHNDSDWLLLTVTNGETAFPPQTKQIGGNLHAGDPPVADFFLGPFAIDESKFTTATFCVTNLVHEDDQQAKASGMSVAIFGGIVAAIGGAGTVVADDDGKIVSAIVGVVGGVIGAIGGLIGLESSDPNCDGEVFTRVLTFPAGQIAPQSIGPTTETAKSPSECGNDPHTTVTYGIRFFRHKIPQF